MQPDQIARLRGLLLDKTNLEIPLERADLRKADHRKLLARQIERSSLTIEQIAKRSKVSPEQLESFLAGDSDALGDVERQRLKDVVETVKAIAATAKRATKPVAADIRQVVNLYDEAE